MTLGKLAKFTLVTDANVICCISFLLYQKLINGDAQMKQQVASYRHVAKMHQRQIVRMLKKPSVFVDLRKGRASASSLQLE